MALYPLAQSRVDRVACKRRQAQTDLTAALRSVGGCAPEPSYEVLKRLSPQDRAVYERAKKDGTIYRGPIR